MFRGTELLSRGSLPTIPPTQLSCLNLSWEVPNIGKENERTIKELAYEVLDLTETESDIVYEPLPEDDPGQRRPDITRAREELDWEPEILLHEGLKNTIRYFELELSAT